MRRRTGERAAALAAVAVLLALAAPCPARGAAPARREQRSGAWRGWERDLVLEVQLDRREVFVGEQVTATVVLRSPVGVVSYDRFQTPPLDGFWAEEIEVPRRLSFALRSVGGVPTRVYTVRKLALFPTRAGRIELGPFEVDLSVRLGADDAFSAFDELRRARRASAPAAVAVKPLPAGAPAGFDPVNVGRWKLSASASPPRVAAGEPVAVRLTATGEGNARTLAIPPLPAIPGARAFAPTASEEVTRGGARLAGTRTVETVLVPDREGTLEVPPLALAFFSPATGRYELARTAALRVTVDPGATPPPGAVALSDRLRPPRAEARLARAAPPPWERAPFRAALALPPLAFAALVLADALRARAAATAPARRARRAIPRARRALASARRALDRGEEPAALSSAAGAVRSLAEDVLGRPVGGETRAALRAALSDAGAPEPGVTALAEALDALDAARFGAGSADARDALARADRAVDLLGSGSGSGSASRSRSRSRSGSGSGSAGPLPSPPRSGGEGQGEGAAS